MKKHRPPRLAKFPAAKQRLLDQLLDRNSEGTITTGERAKLEQLVAQAERLTVANAKRLLEFSSRGGAAPPSAGVPVTVWIQPAHAER